MSAASWRYAYAYVMASVFGGIATVWGTFLILVPSSFALNATWSHIQTHQRTMATIVLTLGLIQLAFCGPVARGVAVIPALLAVYWTGITYAIASVEWRTTGTAVYSSLTLCQWGIAVISGYDAVRECGKHAREVWAIAYETARRFLGGSN